MRRRPRRPNDKQLATRHAANPKDSDCYDSYCGVSPSGPLRVGG
ncbi:hypothetical protein CBM2585_B50173 [Cupriavidus taiwanensis]|nr:hypothetical protein CBM2585_B50173 [Cupriavidus taiwanensis]